MTLVYPRPVEAAHIAIVMHDFSTGGSERIAIRLANQWVRAGRRVSILCGVSQGPLRDLVDPAVTVIGMWPAIPRSLLSRLMLARELANCIALIQPDVIFSPGNFHIPVIGPLSRLIGPERPAIVCKLSNPLCRPGRPAMLQTLFGATTRHMTSAVDSFVAMSASLAEEARAVLGRTDVRIIYEPNIASSYRQPPKLPVPAEPLIVCAGRLVPQKNFELAIRAFARLDPTLGAKLILLGEGEQRIRLEVLVDRLGLNDRVSFAGHVPDIRAVLARASLLLMSSRYEGYPAVLVEALTVGLRVVTTDCTPALSEIMLDKRFGRVVAAEPDALADAMSGLLRCRNDPPLDASALIERHREDHAARAYLDLFDENVQSRRAARATA